MTHDSGANGEISLARREILFSVNFSDTNADDAFDRITRLATSSLDAPISVISFTDGDRHWLKSVVGLDLTDVPARLSLCGHVDPAADLTEVPDAAADSRFAAHPFVAGPEQIRFFASIPLRTADHRVAGTLCVLDRKPRRLTAQQRQILVDLAGMVGHEMSIRRIAATDPLTGAWNRRMLDAVADSEFCRANRLKVPFSLALLDLDHFKAVNDRHGHEAGNTALRLFADTFRSTMRREDWLFRVGGEEFAAILAGCEGDMAFEAVDRLRQEIARRPMPGPEGGFTVTLSGAVIEAADRHGTHHASLESLLRQADVGLYAAKRGGRNRIVKLDARRKQKRTL